MFLLLLQVSFCFGADPSVNIDEREAYIIAKSSIEHLPFLEKDSLTFTLVNKEPQNQESVPRPQRSYVYFVESISGEKVVVRVFSKNTSAFSRKIQIDVAKWAEKSKLSPRFLYSDGIDDNFYITEYFTSQPLSSLNFSTPHLMEKAVSVIKDLHSSEDISYKSEPIVTEIFQQVSSVLGDENIPRISRFREVIWEAALLMDCFFQQSEDIVPCHYDLHSGNFLYDGKKLFLIDWEFSGMGDRILELASFSYYMNYSNRQNLKMLELYFGENFRFREALKFKLAKKLFVFFKAIHHLTYHFVDKHFPFHSKRKTLKNHLSSHELDCYFYDTKLKPREWESIYLNQSSPLVNQHQLMPSISQKMGVICLKSFSRFMNSSLFAKAFKQLISQKLSRKNVRVENLLNVESEKDP